MKTDRGLLTVFALSLLAYILNFWALRFELPDGLYWLSVFQLYLAAWFHALPAYCIQLFALRRAKRRWLAALPALLLLCWLLYCGWGLVNSRDNWEPMMWFIRMFWSVAPAGGLALAWVNGPRRDRHVP